MMSGKQQDENGTAIHLGCYTSTAVSPKQIIICAKRKTNAICTPFFLNMVSAILCTLLALTFTGDSDWGQCVWEKRKVKWPRYRPGVAQRVGRGIALIFHDRGTRRGWVVSSTPRPHSTSRKDPVPILQEAGWTPGPVWTGGKSRPHQESRTVQPVVSRYTDWAARRGGKK